MRPVELEKRNSIIELPESVQANAAQLQTEVVVMAIGAEAWKDESEPRAAPGDHVLVTKFAGFIVVGADGKIYRLVNDRDIFCQRHPEQFKTELKEVANG